MSIELLYRTARLLGQSFLVLRMQLSFLEISQIKGKKMSCRLIILTESAISRMRLILCPLMPPSLQRICISFAVKWSIWERNLD